MPRICVICKKGTVIGRNVSHANNRTRRVIYPNLQRTRIVVNGAVRRELVCTRCIRSGLVVKA